MRRWTWKIVGGLSRVTRSSCNNAAGPRLCAPRGALRPGMHQVESATEVWSEEDTQQSAESK